MLLQVSDKPMFNLFMKSLISLILDIRNISNEENKKLIDKNDLIGYLHEISTKYYKTEIVLLPVDNLQNLPDSVTDKLEGVLIYFDSGNVSLFNQLLDLLKLNLKFSSGRGRFWRCCQIMLNLLKPMKPSFV